MKKSARTTTLCAAVLLVAIPLAGLAANVNNLDVSGTIRLVPSTATDGNIVKDTTRFLHNYGSLNTFLGESAGNFTMIGTANTANGAHALLNNAEGSANTASGTQALQDNTAGVGNSALGAYALFNNTTGEFNTATGVSALVANSTGSNNTASGAQSLHSNTTGGQNTALGTTALMNSTVGTNNTALGHGAGYNLTTGSHNIAIGNSGVASDEGTIRVGSLFQNRAFIAGIRGVTTDVADAIPVVIDSNGQLGTVSSSRRVKDTIVAMGVASEILTQLRPVTFYYKSDQNPKGRLLQYGLIAEEVAAVAPRLVARSASGEIETVYYQFLAPMLLNEYQKQHRTIEAQTARIEAQAAEIAQLKEQTADIAKLQQQVAQTAAALAQLVRAGAITTAAR